MAKLGEAVLPIYEECVQYYTSIDSPIIRDGVLTDGLGSVFVGSQTFRSSRATAYNLTLAAAAGGRGLCNSEYGRGLVVHSSVYGDTSDDFLVLVGQRGLGPCTSGQRESGHMLCGNPPQNAKDTIICLTQYLEWLQNQSRVSGLNVYRTLNISSGAGGGGASLFGIKDKSLIGDVLIAGVVGGGGGSSSVLGYSVVRTLHSEFENSTLNDSSLYKGLLNGKTSISNREFAYNDGFGGYQIESDSLTPLAGAGGGLSSNSNFPSNRQDGRAVGRIEEFAQGGTHCASNDYSLIPLDLRGGGGGFGGGGGGCGGGGGYTGGPILGVGNVIPGGGGYTVEINSYFSMESLTDISFNDGDGYVDIVAADCGCVYECVVYEEEDQFECLCPNDTQLAPDLSDCYICECLLILHTLYLIELTIFCCFSQRKNGKSPTRLTGRLISEMNITSKHFTLGTLL